MRGLKNKNSGRWKQLSLSIVLILLFLVALNSVHGVYQKKKGAQEALSRMEKEAAALKDRENFLVSELNKLETKEGLKFEIRKKLNVAEVGESVAIIVSGPKATSTAPLQNSPWQKFKAFFKNLFD